MKIHCINVIWGKDYVKTFLELSLPTQLTGENLGILNENGTYRIFTTSEDRKIIEESEPFRQLQQMVAVEFIEIPSPRKGEDSIKKMNRCHYQAIRDAAERSAALIFLSPDIVLSSSAFKYIMQAVGEGKRAVAVLSPRLSKEGYAEAYLKKKKGLSSRELVRLALSHLHPLSKSLFWNEKKINAWSSHLFWKLDENNLMARAFHLHPLFVWPENPSILPDHSIDSDYLALACPSYDKWEVIQDSDQMAVFEVSSLSLAKNIVYSPSSAWLLGVWVSRYTMEFQRQFAKKRIYIHASDSDWKEGWLPIADLSDKVIEKIIKNSKSPSYRQVFFWLCYRIRNKMMRSLRRINLWPQKL